MKVIGPDQFINMPWKNGLGSTDEIFKQNDSNGNMIFRISKAIVKTDGPFSFFPNFKRILSIISGNGLVLNEKLLNDLNSFIEFSGDDKIDAKLMDGSIVDFNIIWNPQVFRVNFQILNNFKKIKYDKDQCESLYIFVPDKSCFIDSIEYKKDSFIEASLDSMTIKSDGRIYLISLYYVI